jgi:hypothetical protein
VLVLIKVRVTDGFETYKFAGTGLILKGARVMSEI